MIHHIYTKIPVTDLSVVNVLLSDNGMDNLEIVIKFPTGVRNLFLFTH